MFHRAAGQWPTASRSALGSAQFGNPPLSGRHICTPPGFTSYTLMLKRRQFSARNRWILSEGDITEFFISPTGRSSGQPIAYGRWVH